jgi:hypothetical protein
MKDKTRHKEVNVKPCDTSKDFKILSSSEKQGILKTAKTLLKIQQIDADMIADAAIPIKTEKKGLA